MVLPQGRKGTRKKTAPMGATNSERRWRFITDIAESLVAAERPSTMRTNRESSRKLLCSCEAV